MRRRILKFSYDLFIKIFQFPNDAEYRGGCVNSILAKSFLSLFIIAPKRDSYRTYQKNIIM